jgi:hypothetical protein
MFLFCFYAVQILSHTVQNNITFFKGRGAKAIHRTALLLSKRNKSNFFGGTTSIGRFLLLEVGI